MHVRENLFTMRIDGRDLETLNNNFRKLFDWLEQIDERLNEVEEKYNERNRGDK